MHLGEDELTISHRIGEIKPTRKQLTYRILYATCELNPPFYVNYSSVEDKLSR